MAERSRRVSRGALVPEDCVFEAVTAAKVEHPMAEHLEEEHHGHEDGQTNLFSSILNRWLMSNTFYSSSINSLRYNK